MRPLPSTEAGDSKPLRKVKVDIKIEVHSIHLLNSVKPVLSMKELLQLCPKAAMDWPRLWEEADGQGFFLYQDSVKYRLS